MKYLIDYTQELQSKLFNDNGCFFAFSNEQFLQKRVKGTKYVRMLGGLLCPEENVDSVLDGLDLIQKNGIAQDIEENGKLNIIKRELGNYEAYYTGNLDDVYDALKGYDISQEAIRRVYINELPKQEL